jgi:hypothetical protein
VNGDLVKTQLVQTDATIDDPIQPNYPLTSDYVNVFLGLNQAGMDNSNWYLYDFRLKKEIMSDADIKSFIS